MSVEFEQENDFNRIYRAQQRRLRGFSMINFLIKVGLVKDEKQANIFLICTIVVVILLTIFIFYRFVFGGFIIPKVNDFNTKIMQEYRDQGLTDKALFDKITEDRKSGLIK
jgi:hypothetical protein